MSLTKNHAEILNHFFDKIYVISLKRSTDRHKLLEKNLEGINYEIFWGIDGKKLDLNKLEQEGIYLPYHTRILKKREGKKVSDLTNTQIGCALSHIKVCEDVLINKYQNALIFEDDVIIDANKNVNLESALAELPEDWELLYLGRHGSNNDPSLLLRIQTYLLSNVSKYVQNFERLRVLNPNVIKCCLPRKYSNHLDLSGYHHGAYAYAISNTGARKILNYLLPIVQRNDNAVAELCSYEWIRAFNVKNIAFFPNRSIPSTIND